MIPNAILGLPELHLIDIIDIVIVAALVFHVYRIVVVSCVVFKYTIF